MTIALVLDENLRFASVWNAIAKHNQRGTNVLDVVRVGDEGCPPLGSRDALILEWASIQNRVLVSQDAKSLPGALADLIQRGTVSPGIVLLRKGLNIAQILECLIRVAHVSQPHEWTNAVHWLPPA
jgi:hypothetical protein